VISFPVPGAAAALAFALVAVPGAAFVFAAVVAGAVGAAELDEAGDTAGLFVFFDSSCSAHAFANREAAMIASVTAM
jgi:hypothetical protein